MKRTKSFSTCNHPTQYGPNCDVDGKKWPRTKPAINQTNRTQKQRKQGKTPPKSGGIAHVEAHTPPQLRAPPNFLGPRPKTAVFIAL